MAVDWVSAEELQAKMADPALGYPLWSPWFRVIVKKFLLGWWKDLKGAWKLPPVEVLAATLSFAPLSSMGPQAYRSLPKPATPP